MGGGLRRRRSKRGSILSVSARLLIHTQQGWWEGLGASVIQKAHQSFFFFFFYQARLKMNRILGFGPVQRGPFDFQTASRAG